MSTGAYNPGHVNRPYQRGSHFSIDAMLSSDGKTWKKTHVSDLSSSGLLLTTDDTYEKGDELWLDLDVHGFFSEFEVKTKGTVMRTVMREGKHSYGIAFQGLSPDMIIRIDENVRNNRPVGVASDYGD